MFLERNLSTNERRAACVACADPNISFISLSTNESSQLSMRAKYDLKCTHINQGG